MLFNYHVINSQGLESSGQKEAENRDQLVLVLREQGLYPISVEAAEDHSEPVLADNDVRRYLQALQRFGTARKVFVFRQLALLLASGITLTEALDLIAAMQAGRVKQLLKNINHLVKSGRAFSDALAVHDRVFGKMAVQMVRSAEASGELAATLERIADHIERRAELQRQVVNTLIYPMVTLVMAIGVFIFLVTGVVPKFAEFFAKTGRRVPAQMQTMIDIHDFVHLHWVWLIVLSITVLGLLVVTYRSEPGRYWLDRLALNIPLLSGVLITAAMAQYGWSLASLLRSGLTVVETLQICAGMTGNQAIAADLTAVAEAVLNGKPLYRSIRQPTIPPLIQHMTLVGERSGELVEIMFKAGIYYENELKNKTKVIGAMVEPVAILLIGGLVGFIYFGFFKAIFAISGR